MCQVDRSTFESPNQLRSNGTENLKPTPRIDECTVPPGPLSPGHGCSAAQCSQQRPIVSPQPTSNLGASGPRSSASDSEVSARLSPPILLRSAALPSARALPERLVRAPDAPTYSKSARWHRLLIPISRLRACPTLGAEWRELAAAVIDDPEAAVYLRRI